MRKAQAVVKQDLYKELETSDGSNKIFKDAAMRRRGKRNDSIEVHRELRWNFIDTGDRHLQPNRWNTMNIFSLKNSLETQYGPKTQ